MRTSVFSLGIALLSIFSMSAQWAGSSSTSGNTYRFGNVGIGTSTPDKLFVVSVPALFSGDFVRMGKIVNANTNQRQFNIGAGTNSTGFDFRYPNGKIAFDMIGSSSLTYLALRDYNQVEIFKVSTDGNDGFVQLPRLNSRVVIGDYSNYLQSEGHKLIVKQGSAKIEGNIITNANIGIGTDSFIDGGDTYRLSVDGKVRADGVKVYTTWADYVFEEEYNLPTLEEVKQHIEKNGHLKDIPSAKAVEENGIELGEMNKLLLQKIEELTLYMLQKDEQIKELNQKMESFINSKK